jgi:hypothetical protein
MIFLLSGYFNINNVINNGVIMCQQNHEILLQTLKYAYINKNNFFKNKNDFLYIFHSTGPLVLSNSFIDYTNKYPSKSKELELLDQSYFEGCDVGQIKYNNCKIPPNAIGLHYYESTWVSNNDKLGLKLYYFIKHNFIKIVILLILIYYYSK